jgi:hypothetical protein
MKRYQVDIREDRQGISINGLRWQEWSLELLMPLRGELEEVRVGSCQLLQAYDEETVIALATTYCDDLEREMLVVRAIGQLYLLLSPWNSPARRRHRKAEDNEYTSRKQRIEFEVGCRVMKIRPESIPDPFDVTLRTLA